MFGWIDEEFLSAAALAFGAMQWGHTAGFIAALRAQARRGQESPDRLPSACVILAAKGTLPDFDGNIRAILEQEYPGPVEYLFVTPRETDAAFGAIRRILAGYPGKTARLLHSDETPVTSCGKITDLNSGPFLVTTRGLACIREFVS